MMIENGQRAYSNLVNAQELNVECFRGYGSAFMKSSKMSPDAYVQMAIQLATYRLFGECVGTYVCRAMR